MKLQKLSWFLSERAQKRFWAKIDKRGPDECWPWTAGTDYDGYGKINRSRAHRVAYITATGEEPDGLVCHSCDNRSCCNPRHLFVGTVKQNAHDRLRKGRLMKLSNEQVEQLIADKKSGMTGRQLAAKYGVSMSYALSVAQGVYRVVR